MKIELNIEAIEPTADAADTERSYFVRAAEQALTLAQLNRDVEISLLLVDDAEIQQLNRDYRAKDAATDVLSFPQLEEDELENYPPGLPLLLGDIVISREHVAAQAAAYGHSELREIVFLFTHGLLHLLGWDHERSQEEEVEMFMLQDTILGELGL